MSLSRLDPRTFTPAGATVRSRRRLWRRRKQPRDLRAAGFFVFVAAVGLAWRFLPNGEITAWLARWVG